MVTPVGNSNIFFSASLRKALTFENTVVIRLILCSVMGMFDDELFITAS